MRCLLVLVAALVVAAPAFADDKPKPNALTPKEIADGWIMLFDGETTFGWKIDGDAKVKDGTLVLGGGKATIASPTTVFGNYDMRLETTPGSGRLAFRTGSDTSDIALTNQPMQIGVTARVLRGGGSALDYSTEVGPDKIAKATVNVLTESPAVLRIEVPAGATVGIKSIKVKPIITKPLNGRALSQPLFNGKDLAGWKVFQDPKRSATKFEVTKAGELHATNGPGDLQTTTRYADFVLQLECKTNGKGLNSGVFFRCVPDQYQQGYEAQIQNAYIGNDRTKPVDFGTGAIYRRVPARKVVSNDNEWFTMTVVARGPHISTWVNGYQTVDWTDDRKPSDNPRQGLKTGKGHISIQGHDPTTDLLFRNIRIAELPAGK